ncbi:MAG TPA: hypothetical protein VLH60_07740, partial [Sedimentisphaerales bacterium]|nr:hypothetical protein [Sedimentisphaerales bacterium]
TNLAVTFEVLAVDEAGSEVSVYAADKKAMSGVLAEFQKAGFDPLAFEPESATLARWLDAVVPRNERTGAMYVLFAGDACCLVVYAPGRDAPLIRTIIVPPGAATAALAREITLTVASLKLQAPLSAVRVFDLKGRTDLALLRQRLGVPVDPFDLMTAAGFTPAIVDQPLEPLAVAAACGAAMGDFIKSRRADFREDFSPYLGRTRIVDKTVKAISLALTFIVVAVGIYLQLRLFVINRDRQLLADTIAPDYRAAMHTQNVPPLSEAVNRLNSELRAVRGLKAGMLGQETVTGLFTNFLEAANALPRSVDLQLNSIRVTPRAITLSGSTDRPENTLALLKKVGDSPYLASENLTQQFKNGRDEFGVTILPRRSRPGAAHAGQN